MIEINDIIAILSDAIYTVVLSSAPMLLVAVAVGLIISIFQATTQINEQTLAFVPKIVCVMLALLLFGNFVFTNVGGFTVRLFTTLDRLLTGTR